MIRLKKNGSYPGMWSDEMRNRISEKVQFALAPRKGERRHDLSEANRLSWANLEIRARRIAGLLGKKRPKLSETNRRTWADPVIREKRSLGISQALLASQRLLESNRRNARNPERNKKLSASLRRVLAIPEVKARQSLAQIRTWQDPVIRQRRIDSDLQAWADGKRKRIPFHPNRFEVSVLSALQKKFPSWKWRFNTQKIVGGKVPDFVCRRGIPIMVDAFGDYWHRKDGPEEIATRRDIFSLKGYYLVIVWEHEFKKNPAIVADRVRMAMRKFFP